VDGAARHPAVPEITSPDSQVEIAIPETRIPFEEKNAELHDVDDGAYQPMVPESIPYIGQVKIAIPEIRTSSEEKTIKHKPAIPDLLNPRK
jgi:hypothetical protein